MTTRTSNATYVGPIKQLRGKTAMVRQGERPGEVLAQFDSPQARLGNVGLDQGWHTFEASEFQEGIK